MKAGVVLFTIFLCSCSNDNSEPNATEILSAKAWQENIKVHGEIKAANNTPLNVPGNGWDSRILLEMVPDGSVVKKGQIIASFDAPRSRMDLSQADTELLRKELAAVGLTNDDAMNHATLDADRAKVKADLQLSRRYVDADVSVFSRNQILDALQDVGFLTAKQTYLNWKNGQIQARTHANLALLQSQKDSVELKAQQLRKNLSGLDLIAPHDGVFNLVKSWDGSKPQIGSNRRPGEEIGMLPDLSHLVASFSLPEGRAFGLKTGLPIHARLAGTGTEIELIVTKVGSSATVKSNESPVKFSEFEANIPEEIVNKLALKPGQALSATVSVIEKKNVLTVPNIALVQEADHLTVFTRNGKKMTQQKVELGVRGAIRSEIKNGLTAGQEIILTPPEKKADKT
ncbi:efflux RND transporter periplasmic adaptor subunit [Undibacterium sp. Ji67W]|uniref:efflux RND transporter periplasmic adaptor subunit n=1 Tax=Undibacterium sp. Ji67W TaxID=3413042 RepID=UPI003BF0808B